MIEKHFPNNNCLSKIFNNNTLILSYSCTENLEKNDKKHKNKFSNKHLKQNHSNIDSRMKINNINNRLCNCRSPINCPLQNKCLTESIVYQCTISSIENPVILVARKIILN